MANELLTGLERSQRCVVVADERALRIGYFCVRDRGETVRNVASSEGCIGGFDTGAGDTNSTGYSASDSEAFGERTSGAFLLSGLLG